MKKILLSILVISAFLIVSCGSKNEPKNKPITKNIPSVDKTKREGTPYASQSKVMQVNAVVLAAASTEYNVLERLYNTVWFQTEKEYDDGVLEEETEFVFFNADSSMYEREMENGIMEAPEEDDYATMRYIKDITDPRPDGSDVNNKNACVVSKISKDDGRTEVEYEGYWLKDKDTLYIVEGHNENEVTQKMQRLFNNLPSGNDTEKYTLSTEPVK